MRRLTEVKRFRADSLTQASRAASFSASFALTVESPVPTIGSMIPGIEGAPYALCGGGGEGSAVIVDLQLSIREFFVEPLEGEKGMILPPNVYTIYLLLGSDVRDVFSQGFQVIRDDSFRVLYVFLTDDCPWIPDHLLIEGLEDVFCGMDRTWGRGKDWWRCRSSLRETSSPTSSRFSSTSTPSCTTVTSSSSSV